MNETCVYVVRVYRRESDGMSGVVESVASGEQAPFHTSAELWRALQELPSPRRRIASNNLGEEELP